jgi:hypothetical protein
LKTATDWTFLYCQLTALNLPDPIFHASNFARLPVRLITDVLDNSARVSRMRANANSVATAKMGAMVASALGSKNNQVKVSDFLPYEMEEDNTSVSERTKEVLKWALKTQKLPTAIVAMVGSELS